MCETTLSLRGRTLAINQDVNCTDTRLCSNNKKLQLQWLVRVYVEFGSTTLISDSEDLTLQLAVAHEDDSTLDLRYKISTTVIMQGYLSGAHMKEYITNMKWKPNTDHRRTTMASNTAVSKFVLRYLKSRARGCRGAYKESIGMSCLLYTSPSPRDGLLSRMPSSA